MEKSTYYEKIGGFQDEGISESFVAHFVAGSVGNCMVLPFCL
jgi:hypothetical protein